VTKPGEVDPDDAERIFLQVKEPGSMSPETEQIFDFIIDQFAGDVQPSDEYVDALIDVLMNQILTEEMSPAEAADILEPTSPKIAAQVRSLKSPEAVVAYINVVVAILQLILAMMNLANQPTRATPQQIVINIQNSTTVNMSTPPDQHPRQ
jgi:hypothetical protein